MKIGLAVFELAEKHVNVQRDAGFNVSRVVNMK